MYNPPNLGLGNILMHLCQVSSVTDKIYDGMRGEYIKVKLPIVQESSEVETPHLYVIPELHQKIKDIIEPTEKCKTYIEKYKHLIKDIDFSLQIRRGALSKSEIVSNISAIHCNDDGLNKFFEIMNSTKGNVFLSSDCMEIKRIFKEKYGDRIRFIDNEVQYIINTNKDDPWTTFTDFFLLSMSPFVFMSGGNVDMNTFSTFGYMACMYGGVPFKPVFN
jgi:hypothetical protein